jgi:hypothetical protein
VGGAAERPEYQGSIHKKTHARVEVRTSSGHPYHPQEPPCCNRRAPLRNRLLSRPLIEYTDPSRPRLFSPPTRTPPPPPTVFPVEYPFPLQSSPPAPQVHPSRQGLRGPLLRHRPVRRPPHRRPRRPPRRRPLPPLGPLKPPNVRGRPPAPPTTLPPRQGPILIPGRNLPRANCAPRRQLRRRCARASARNRRRPRSRPNLVCRDLAARRISAISVAPLQVYNYRAGGGASGGRGVGLGGSYWGGRKAHPRPSSTIQHLLPPPRRLPSGP